MFINKFNLLLIFLFLKIFVDLFFWTFSAVYFFLFHSRKNWFTWKGINADVVSFILRNCPSPVHLYCVINYASKLSTDDWMCCRKRMCGLLAAWWLNY